MYILNYTEGAESEKKQGSLESWGTHRSHQTRSLGKHFLALAATFAHHACRLPCEGVWDDAVTATARGHPKLKQWAICGSPFYQRLTEEEQKAGASGFHKRKRTSEEIKIKNKLTRSLYIEASLLLPYLEQFWYIPPLQLHLKNNNRESACFSFFFSFFNECQCTLCPYSTDISTIYFFSTYRDPHSYVSIFPAWAKAGVSVLCLHNFGRFSPPQRHRRETYGLLAF